MEKLYYIKKDSTKIAYSVAGKGEALVLLHGFGADCTRWEKFGWARDLQKYYTTIMIDIRGLGESSISYDPNFYRMENLLEDIEQVVNACGFSTFHIFGHSYGGSIALRAIKSGLPIQKAIIASGTWDADFFHTDIPQWITEYSRMNERKKNHQLTGFDQEEIEWIHATDLDNYLAQFKAWTEFESVTIDDVNIPVFLYSGTKDEKRAIQFIEENKATFQEKHWKYKIYEGMDHVDLVKCEDTILKDVLEFLNT